MAWLKNLLSSNQWLTDLIFINYAGGSVYSNWSGITAYAYLDRVIYIDGAIYELQNQAGLISTTPPNVDLNWIKILDTFIGVRERARYNSQKLMLEYALNRKFQVSTFSTIEWEVIWIAGVPVPQTAPPYTQIYIKPVKNSQTNFWLSNGAGLTSYMGNTTQNYYMGNAYPTYTINKFIIYVPTAVYTAIGSYQVAGVTADQAIRAIVDKYADAGSIYTITQY